MSLNVKVGKASGNVTITAHSPRLTRELAISASEFHAGDCALTVGPKGGIARSCEHWRRNGQTKTWKTRPEEFRVPVKFGLYRCDYLTQREVDRMHAASECELDKLSDEDARRMAEEVRNAAC